MAKLKVSPKAKQAMGAAIHNRIKRYQTPPTKPPIRNAKNNIAIGEPGTKPFPRTTFKPKTKRTLAELKDILNQYRTGVPRVKINHYNDAKKVGRESTSDLARRKALLAKIAGARSNPPTKPQTPPTKPPFPEGSGGPRLPKPPRYQTPPTKPRPRREGR